MVDAVKHVTILGATGSIGQTTCKLISQFPNHYQTYSVCGGKNAPALAKVARDQRAKVAVIADTSQYQTLKSLLSDTDIEVHAGMDIMADIAAQPVDIVVAGIMGSAGLQPTYAAVQAGNTVALANKESLVMAGDFMMDAAAQSGATLLPVDSEHSALFQVFDTTQRSALQQLCITASGGPLRHLTHAQLTEVTPAQAIKHPNWQMGAKISVDSATLMNKGLELIEAMYLFSVPASQLSAVVHSESIVHAFAQYRDGSTLAHLSLPDMSIPIGYALSYPQRMTLDLPTLDLAQIGALHFETPDTQRFPCLALATQAMHAKGAACIVLNAANETAVEAFLSGQIRFLDIAAHVQDMLQHAYATPQTLSDVAELHREIRCQPIRQR